MFLLARTVILKLAYMSMQTHMYYVTDMSVAQYCFVYFKSLLKRNTTILLNLSIPPAQRHVSVTSVRTCVCAGVRVRARAGLVHGFGTCSFLQRLPYVHNHCCIQ